MALLLHPIQIVEHLRLLQLRVRPANTNLDEHGLISVKGGGHVHEYNSVEQ